MPAFDHLLAQTQEGLRARDTSGFSAKAEALLGMCHLRQRDYVLDHGRLVAALVARRSGKTTGERIAELRTMLLVPKAQVVFVAVTRTQAEDLMWAPLKDLAEQLELQARFNETKLRMTLRKNGSELQLVGADDKHEIEKLRGRKFHRAGIDEAGTHKPELLKNLVERILWPALGDYRGQLAAVGTPTHVLSGLFYEATRPGSTIGRPYQDRNNPEHASFAGWSVHKWHREDNVFIPHLWEEALIAKAANGWSDQNPIWRREYLGQWVADDTGFVYKFRRHHPETGEPWNIWTPGPKTKGNPFGLPEGHTWRYVYGLDFGSGGGKVFDGEGARKGDPFALEVLAFSDTEPSLYQVYEHVATERLSVTAIAELLKSLIATTGYPDGMAADIAGSGELVLSELRTVHGLNIEAADKGYKYKNGAIEVINADLIDGRLKLLDGKQLEQQMTHLQWDETGIKENRNQRNDACDALIYARKKAGHRYAVDPDPPGPLPGSPEALDRRMEEDEDRLARPRSEFGEWAGGDDDYSDYMRGGDRYP